MPSKHPPFAAWILSSFFVAAQVGIIPAVDTSPFPDPGGKKGLQVQMVDDALALGIKHATLNVGLSGLFTMEAAAPDRPDLALKVGERSLRADERALKHLDSQVKAYSDAGVVVYLILLVHPTKQPEKDALLLHPSAKADQKYNIAAFNNVTPEGRDLYKGLIAMLASRYSGSKPEQGRVWGYIVGNEVNSQWMWYNLGKMPVDQAVNEYEQAVRLTHDAVREHSAHARVYLSFDHHWNASMPGISNQESYRGREFLDKFAALARSRGDFEWHVAHHPYPDDLGNPRTWEDKAAWPNEDAPHITFKNLEVACRYMEKESLLWQGKLRRIILSEQGIHCPATPDGEQLQAAGFAYAWEKTAKQPLIDALIWHRHVDHSHEGGLRLGLWENKPGSIADPGRKRPIYYLFEKAGGPQWREAAQSSLPVIGIKSWEELP